MDNSLKTKEKPPKRGANAPPKRQTGGETEETRRQQTPNPKPRIASAQGRVKPLARFLRCATALRVTAPLGCGSDGWYGRKIPFGFTPNRNE